MLTLGFLSRPNSRTSLFNFMNASLTIFLFFAPAQTTFPVEKINKTGAKIVYVELDSNAELDSDVHNYSDTNYSDTLWVQVISDREIEFLRSVLQDGFDEAWFDNKQKMYRFWWD
ncbi:hypothetical protein LCGC14_0814460 [marine sediment metagenome]|uniref:Uncharacterized protein n=1 Tax=marine sediment metagenome TaxID=412755 RepID=A0A0F9ST92_9ZZZZ